MKKVDAFLGSLIAVTRGWKHLGTRAKKKGLPKVHVSKRQHCQLCLWALLGTQYWEHTRPHHLTTRSFNTVWSEPYIRDQL